MASSVNKKFVVILTVGVIGTLGAAGLAMKFMFKSAADHIRIGDSLAATDPIESMKAYSRAVNKEPNNASHIAKWAESIGRITPESRQEYDDRFRDFIMATRRLAEVKRTDVAAHRAVLDPLLNDYRRGGAGPQAWASLVQQVDATIKLFPSGDKGIDGVRRYRGIARAAILGLGQRLSDDEMAATRADLEAAIAYDPNDDLATASFVDFLRFSADVARQTNDPEKAAALLAEGEAKIKAYVETHPDSSIARAAYTNVLINNAAEKARASGMNSTQFAAVVQPIIEDYLATVERENPAKLDMLAAAQAIELANNNRINGAYERGLAVFDKLVAARDGAPSHQFARASFMFNARKFRDAATAFEKITELKNRPVSYEGVSLFAMRDMAAVRKVDALLGVWETETDAAKRKAILDEVKKARDEVASRTTVDDIPKLLMAGKIAMAEGDLAEARKLLGQYNAKVPTVNVEAQLLLARVLERQGLLGEARQCYQRIIDARAANLNTYLQKANLEIELKNYQNALDDLEKANLLSPDNPGIKMQIQRVQAILTNGRDAINPQLTTDPLVRLLAEAEQCANATPPDFKCATEKLKEARKIVKEPRQFVGMAQVLARMNNIPEAIETCDQGLAKFPGDKALKDLRDALSIADPVKAAEDRINASELSAAEKSVQLYTLYARVGQRDRALKELENAEKIQPDHPVVVSARFEQALQAKDLDKARGLAERAKTLNLDKAGGRLYQATLLRAEGKYKDALLLVQQSIELDPVNPAGHRLAGELHFLSNDLPNASKSLSRALEIQPQDPGTIVLLLKVLLSDGKPTLALERARDSLKFGINENEFVQIWLNLEFDHGDKAKAIDRRKRIFDSNPGNVENAIALATILLRSGLLDQAAEVITALEAIPEAKEQAGLLRAAEVGSRGDTARAEKLFDESIARLNQNNLDGQLHLDFARMMAQQGKVDFAAMILEKGKRYELPATMLVSRTLGDTFFAAGDFAKALAAYSNAREKVNEDTGQLLLKRMIECNLKMEKIAEAEKLLEPLNVDKTTDTQVILLASEAAVQRGDVARARALLDRAISVDQKSDVAFVRRADFNVNDTKFFEDAMADYEQALRLNPRNTRARIMYAECWARKGDVQRSVDELAAGLRQEPTNPDWRNAHVRLLLNLSRTNDAIASLQEMINLTNDPRWPQMAGFIYQSAGDMPAAVQMFKAGWNVRRGPVSGKALVDALLSLPTPDVTQARDVVNAPEFLADADPYSRLTRARVEMLEKRPDVALIDAKAAVAMLDVKQLREGYIAVDEMRRIWPNPVDLVAAIDSMVPEKGWPEAMRLNVVMQRLRVEAQREQAMAELEKLASSTDPQISVPSLSVLGTTHFNSGNPAKAVEAYQRGLKIEPENLELLNNLAFVMSKGLKQHAEALPIAEKAAAKDATNSNVIDTLGAIKLELGRLDEAEKEFERARSLSADSLVRTMPTVHLIEVKIRKNQLVDADQLLRELEDYERRDPRVKANYAAEVERARELRKAAR